jgi:hypothetical protein
VVVDTENPFGGDEGTAYLFQQFWVIPIASPKIEVKDGT